MGAGIRIVAVLAIAAGASAAWAQQPTTEYVDRDGVRYAVTKQQVPVQVPVYETRPQQQTTYRQQIVTENVQHQQVYHVPVTQYQIVTRTHNRWNPFAEPYQTHHYEPITTWQQQVGTVQIPVQRVTVVPETRTVEQKIASSYKMVYNTVITERVVGMTPTTGPGQNTMMAASQPASSTPTASLQKVDSPVAQVASNPYGGQQLTQDPPKYSTAPTPPNSAWQPMTPPNTTQTATQPTPPAQPQSRY